MDRAVGVSQPEVSVGVITYNGRSVLPLCLDSILTQTYPKIRVFIVDNASTDGTPEWVAENYPTVEVFHYPENKGPNPARNMAILKSTTPLVLLVDDDVVLKENCVDNLLEAYHQYPDAAIWVPRVVYYDQPNIIQTEGTYIYYLAEAIILNSDTPIEEGISDITPVQAAGGMTLLIARKPAINIGLFDEDYFFGRTDGEFTFRISQAGYPIYSVPQAVSYHRVKVRGLSKVFYQIRNRWYFILTTYAWKTILLILPALITYELFLLVFLTLKGQIMEYFKANAQVFVNLPMIFQKRQSVQALRKVQDRDLLHSGEIEMRKDLLKNPVISLLKSSLNGFFNLYWQLIYPLI
jgi:hypothetical protein